MPENTCSGALFHQAADPPEKICAAGRRFMARTRL